METNEAKHQAFRCLDCGGLKSTEKTLRCWDCALKVKRSNWEKASSIRADNILHLRAHGHSMTDIARQLGVSRQRLYQVIESAGKSVSRKPVSKKKEDAK